MYRVNTFYILKHLLGIICGKIRLNFEQTLKRACFKFNRTERGIEKPSGKLKIKNKSNYYT